MAFYSEEFPGVKFKDFRELETLRKEQKEQRRALATKVKVEVASKCIAEVKNS